MGVTAIYKCKKCGNKFKADDGAGMCFVLFRCVNCDTTKSVDRPIKGDVGKCLKCAGELREDLGPMCQKCKSRDVEEKEIICLYD